MHRDCYCNTPTSFYIFASNRNKVEDNKTTTTITTTRREKERKELEMFVIRTSQVGFTKDTP